MATSTHQAYHANDERLHFHEQQCQKQTEMYIIAIGLIRSNEHAAECIEAGNYKTAVMTLLKSLKISEQIDDRFACNCDECSLEECMIYSQRREDESYDNDDDDDDDVYMFNNQSSSPCHRRQDLPMSCNKSNLNCNNITTSSYPKTTESQEEEENESFVHTRPICVTPYALHSGHWIGQCTMQLILVFNLALTYHLQAMESKQQSEQRDLALRSLQLYEYAYQWKKHGRISSLRFNMVLANNLAEIHLLLGDIEKAKMCLQNVLSTLLYLLDHLHSENQHSDEESEELYALAPFVRSTARLILREQCAAAA